MKKIFQSNDSSIFFFVTNIKIQIIFIFLMILLIININSCKITDAESAQKNDPILISASETELLSLVNSMKDPKGLISCTLKNIVGTPTDVLVLKKDQGGGTCEDRINFHEYFIFDEDENIFILQTNPIVFLYINSIEFNYHLNNEYEQFKNNPTIGATDKIKNSQTFYRRVGSYDIALTFTPNEMTYSDRGANDGRIQDRNSASYIDFWRLLDASGKAVVFIPEEFIEERLFTDTYCQVQKGKTRKIYTPDSSMTLSDLPEWFRDPNDERFDEVCYNSQRNDKSTIRPWYELRSDLSTKLKFFIAFGENLEINDALLGSEELEFADRLELTRPYAFFLTVPLGSTSDAAEENGGDFLSNRHGFGLQVRGDVDFLLEGAKTLGMPGYETSFSPVKVLSASSNGVQVTLNWSQTSDVQILHYATAQKKTLEEIEAMSDSSFTTIANFSEINEKSFTINAATGSCAAGIITKGCTHWFRVKGVSTTPSNAVVVTPREASVDEIIFTEIMWSGTAIVGDTDSYDEWFEIKNDSSEIVSVSELDFYNGTTSQSDIVFGPNFNASSTLDGHEALGSAATDPESFLYPGEYAIIARKSDVFFSNFTGLKIFIRKTDNLTNGGTTLTIGKDVSGETIVTTIDYKTYDGTYGNNDPKKSMVLNTKGGTRQNAGDASWITSVIDSNQPSSGLNYATPGYAEVGEY